MTDNATAPAFSDADALMAVSDQIQRNDDPAYARIMGRILSLGLSQNLLQLLTEGYTVVRGAMTADMVERAKTAILRCVATRRGQRLNAERNLPDDYRGMDYVAYLLFEDDVFQEILLELRALGKTVLLSSHIFSTLSHTCDRIYWLKEGRIEQVAQREEFPQLEAELREVVVGQRLQRLGLK